MLVEWAVPRAIESETTNNEQAVVTGGEMIPKTGKSSKPDNAPIGKDITSDPNLNLKCLCRSLEVDLSPF